MPLNAQGYFNALRSYLNTEHYEVRDTESDQIVMSEKIFVANQTKPVEYSVRLKVTGEVLVINLDTKRSRNGKQKGSRSGNQSPALFHFLDDTAKPWSKRCDFVIFHRAGERINAYCIEFKSMTLPDTLVDQLKASEAWCRALHSTIKHYTNKAKRLHLTKFVVSNHPDPAVYLDPVGKYLKRDHSIRHYLYRDINGLALDALDNTNVETIF
jgi:hypothetical protein